MSCITTRILTLFLDPGGCPTFLVRNVSLNLTQTMLTIFSLAIEGTSIFIHWGGAGAGGGGGGGEKAYVPCWAGYNIMGHCIGLNKIGV